MAYNNAIFKLTWTLYILPDMSLVGMPRWIEAAVTSVMPSKNTTYVTLQFTKDKHDANKDWLTVQGFSRKLLCEYIMYVCEFYNLDGQPELAMHVRECTYYTNDRGHFVPRNDDATTDTMSTIPNELWTPLLMIEDHPNRNRDGSSIATVVR